MLYDSIQNQERYRSCFCNKDCGDSIVEYLEFAHNKTGVAHIFRSEILFMVKGTAHFMLEGFGTGRRLKRGEFIFVPAGARLACEIARDSAILQMRLSENLPECSAVGMDKISGNVTPHKLPEEGFHTLKANRRIRNMVSELIITLTDGFRCRHFLEGEANRLRFLLHAYYPEEDRVKFFSHMLTPDIKFSEFVRMNYTKFRSIFELSNALCMTPQAFSHRFKKVFGMTPHKWMLQEKARHIYHDICRSDIPLKEIALKYDFPLSSNFFRFCKQTFGESPGNIRKGLHNNVGD